MENRDLWEMLLTELRNQDDQGVMVQFWLIPREDNEADPYAKAGTFAEKGESLAGVIETQDQTWLHR